jgi:hypothetical protein
VKKYTFEQLRHVRAGIIGISYLIFSFVLITLLAILTQDASLCIVIMFLLIFTPVIFYKKLIPVFEETITINESGFHIKSQNRNIDWNNIRWFRIDNKTSPLIDIIEFGVVNGKRVSFTYYKKTQKSNDWQLFKNDIVELVDSNCENLRNYYDTKIWKTLIHIIIISWIIIPSVLIGLGFDIVKVIPMVLILIGSTITIITVISNSRKKKLKQ